MPHVVVNTTGTLDVYSSVHATCPADLQPSPISGIAYSHKRRFFCHTVKDVRWNTCIPPYAVPWIAALLWQLQSAIWDPRFALFLGADRAILWGQLHAWAALPEQVLNVAVETNWTVYSPACSHLTPRPTSTVNSWETLFSVAAVTALYLACFLRQLLPVLCQGAASLVSGCRQCCVRVPPASVVSGEVWTVYELRGWLEECACVQEW